MDITSKDQVILLKNIFRVNFCMLMTSILKILLNKNEEKLACLMTTYYQLALDDDMICRAIEHQHYEWLQYVWVFKKNFLGPRNQAGIN